jgi:hypothetical protein
MKKSKYLIFSLFLFLFGTKHLISQSSYQKMKKEGFSSELLMSAGIYPDSNDFNSEKSDYKNENVLETVGENEPKTIEELAQERALKGLEKQMKLHSTQEQMKPIMFDAKATHFDRFRKSPCFDKIGFNPMQLQTPEAVQKLEEIYSDCEFQHSFSKFIKGTFFVIFILVLLSIVYLEIGIKKTKRFFSKKQSSNLNENT